MKELAITIIGAGLLALCHASGYFQGVDTGVNRMQLQAIERGFAEYDSVTGKWQWKQETEQKEVNK